MKKTIVTKFLNKQRTNNYTLNNGVFVNVNKVESKIKKYFNEKFIVYGKQDYNVLITDKHIDIHTINQDLKPILKIQKIILINNMNNFLTPSLSINRDKLIKYAYSSI